MQAWRLNASFQRNVLRVSADGWFDAQRDVLIDWSDLVQQGMRSGVKLDESCRHVNVTASLDSDTGRGDIYS